MSYAQRILASSTSVEAATPKQLSAASAVMFAMLGPWDKAKDQGGGNGTLTWKASNPNLKKFPGLKGATLSYDGQSLSVAFAGLDVKAEGKNWVGVSRELKAMRAEVSPEAKSFITKLVRVKSTQA